MSIDGGNKKNIFGVYIFTVYEEKGKPIFSK